MMTDGEGNPSSLANTEDNATTQRVSSETSDAKEDEPVNSEDELGEQGPIQLNLL